MSFPWGWYAAHTTLLSTDPVAATAATMETQDCPMIPRTHPLRDGHPTSWQWGFFGVIYL